MRIQHELNTFPSTNCTERFFKDYIILTNLLGPSFVWGRHLADTLIIGIDAIKKTSLANSTKNRINSSNGICCLYCYGLYFSLCDLFISTTTQQDHKGRCEYTEMRCCD